METKLRRWNKKSQPRKKIHSRHSVDMRRGLNLEPLEPRVLLNADQTFVSGLVDVNGTVAGGSRVNFSNLQNEDAGVAYNNFFSAQGAPPTVGVKSTALGAISLTSARVGNTTTGLGTGTFGLLAIYAYEGLTVQIGNDAALGVLRSNFDPDDGPVPGGTLPSQNPGGVLRVYDRSSLPDSLDLNDPTNWVPNFADLNEGLVAELIITHRANDYQAGNPLAGPNPTTLPQVLAEELVNTFIIDLNDAFGGSEGDIKYEFTDLFDVTQETAGSLFKNLTVDPGLPGPADDGLRTSVDLLTNLDQEAQAANFPDLNDLANIADANSLFDGFLDAAFGAGNHVFSGNVNPGDEFNNLTGDNNQLLTGGDVGLLNVGGIAIPGGQFEVLTGSIHGFKFEDVDADGNYEPGAFPADIPFDPNLIFPVEFELTGTDDFGMPVGPLVETINANGEFWFENLVPGDYTLREVIEDFPSTVMPSTTPTQFPVRVNSGEELVWELGAAMLPPGDPRVEVLDDRLIFGNFVKGSIHGIKFQDVDANGVYDPLIDNRLPDVTFELDGTDGMGMPVMDSTITNDNGEFWFTTLKPGTYTVTEIVPAGSVPTTPTSVVVEVLSGQEFVAEAGQAMLGPGQFEVFIDPDLSGFNEDLLFGNVPVEEPGSIHGFKFLDVDADGIYEPGGIPVPDVPFDPILVFPVEFELTGMDDVGNPIGPLMETIDASGQFWFVNLPAGDYVLRELVEDFPETIMPSTETQVALRVNAGEELVWELGAAMLPPGSPQVEVLDPRLIFGNFVKGSIHGFKFEDVDTNGLYDPLVDIRLPDVTFELDGTDGMGMPVMDSTTTNANGEFWFTALKPGNYTVTEIVPPGSSPTTPTFYTDDVFSGVELVAEPGQAMLGPGQVEVFVGVPLMFGNAPEDCPGSIHGFKFKDKNGDGKKGLFEPKLEGVEILLTGPITAAGPGASISTFTNRHGEYWFENLVPGVYTVTEVPPPGSLPTTHPVGDPSVTVTVPSGVELVGKKGQSKMGHQHNSGRHHQCGDDHHGGDHDHSGGHQHGDGHDHSGDHDHGDGHHQGGDHDHSGDDHQGSGHHDGGGNQHHGGGHDHHTNDQRDIVEIVDKRLRFGNIFTGSIHGYKFHDLNGNGHDNHEPRVAGVDITLTGDVDGNGTTDTITVLTDANGAYWYDDLYPGRYSVSETVPDGWKATTRTSVNVRVKSHIEYVAERGQGMLLPGQREKRVKHLAFGNILVPEVPGSIHGFKFEDKDGDGHKDHSEDTIKGVEIVLTNTATLATISTHTNRHGEYWYEDLVPGEYTVSEIVPDGWAPTTDPSVTVIVESGIEFVAKKGQSHHSRHTKEVLDKRLAFGNIQLGSIHGYKFEDLDGDGRHDHGEPRLEGIEILLEGDTDGDGSVEVVSTITDLHGEYWYENLYPGWYTVSEVQPPDSVPTTDPTVDVHVKSGQEWVAKKGQAMLGPGQKEKVDKDLAFGNIFLGSIHGYKFEDLNGNGHDDGEPRLEGVKIKLRGNVDGHGKDETLETFTDIDGRYWFEGLYPDRYRVSETVPDDAVPTTDTSVHVTVASGVEVTAESGQAMLGPHQEEREDERLAFGNVFLGSIHGYKFEDINGNGIDDGEPRLGGVKITLRGDIDGDGDNDKKHTHTHHRTGEYWFDDLFPGEFTVTEHPKRHTVPTTHPVSNPSHTVFVQSREEHVAQSGQAMLGPHQVEVPDVGLAFGNQHISHRHSHRHGHVGHDDSHSSHATTHTISTSEAAVDAAVADLSSTVPGSADQLLYDVDLTGLAQADSPDRGDVDSFAEAVDEGLSSVVG